MLTLTSIGALKFAEMWKKTLCAYKHGQEGLKKEKVAQSTLLTYIEKQ
jgi:hypothetical protein